MEKSILLFDGVCNLCSGLVQFVLSNEKDSNINFAALQSKIGKQLLKDFKVKKKGLENIVFIENGKVYEKSSAVLKIVKHLKMPWNLASTFTIVPQFLSDGIYDLVAKNRYRMFGKKDECWIPEAKWKSRFID